MPWPLKKSEPAVKYRKKGQRINEKKKIQYIRGRGRFFLSRNKIIRSAINLDHTCIVIGIVTLFLKSPPSVEENDYTK